MAAGYERVLAEVDKVFGPASISDLAGATTTDFLQAAATEGFLQVLGGDPTHYDYSLPRVF